MLQVEEFQHQNKTCYRKELEGCPVEITEQSYQATLGKLEYTRHLKRWKAAPSWGGRWPARPTGRCPSPRRSGRPAAGM